MRCTATYTTLTVTWCHSECCVPSGLNFEAIGGFRCRLLFVQLFASRACKHDMSTHSWFNSETFEIAPTPLFGRLFKVLHPLVLFRETTVLTKGCSPMPSSVLNVVSVKVILFSISTFFTFSIVYGCCVCVCVCVCVCACVCVCVCVCVCMCVCVCVCVYVCV